MRKGSLFLLKNVLRKKETNREQREKKGEMEREGVNTFFKINFN